MRAHIGIWAISTSPTRMLPSIATRKTSPLWLHGSFLMMKRQSPSRLNSRRCQMFLRSVISVLNTCTEKKMQTAIHRVCITYLSFDRSSCIQGDRKGGGNPLPTAAILNLGIEVPTGTKGVLLMSNLPWVLREELPRSSLLASPLPPPLEAPSA